jgi:hypothetical protein
VFEYERRVDIDASANYKCRFKKKKKKNLLQTGTSTLLSRGSEQTGGPGRSRANP